MLWIKGKMTKLTLRMDPLHPCLGWHCCGEDHHSHGPDEESKDGVPLHLTVPQATQPCSTSRSVDQYTVCVKLLWLCYSQSHLFIWSNRFQSSVSHAKFGKGSGR